MLHCAYNEMMVAFPRLGYFLRTFCAATIAWHLEFIPDSFMAAAGIELRTSACFEGREDMRRAADNTLLRDTDLTHHAIILASVLISETENWRKLEVRSTSISLGNNYM